MDENNAQAEDDAAGFEGTEDLATLFPDGNGRYPFAALERISGLDSARLNEKLWQQVWQGNVSNDAFASLRRAIETRFTGSGIQTAVPRAGTRRRTGGRMTFQRWRASRPSTGNWFRLTYPVMSQDLLEREELKKERVRLLLDRYGIVFRELLARELPMLRWAPLFRSLRLMELSGELLAGHFFEGIDGVQFISAASLPQFTQSLPEDAVYWINGIDPASLCGLDVPAVRERLPKRLPGIHIVYHGERPVIVSHRMGIRLDIMVPADHPRMRDYFSFLAHLLNRSFMPLRNICIQTINDTPAPEQRAYVTVLADLFETIVDHQEITLYRRHW